MHCLYAENHILLKYALALLSKQKKVTELKFHALSNEDLKKSRIYA